MTVTWMNEGIHRWLTVNDVYVCVCLTPRSTMGLLLFYPVLWSSLLFLWAAQCGGWLLTLPKHTLLCWKWGCINTWLSEHLSRQHFQHFFKWGGVVKAHTGLHIVLYAFSKFDLNASPTLMSVICVLSRDWGQQSKYLYRAIWRGETDLLTALEYKWKY